MDRSKRFWNPYVAGVALGLVLLSTFLIMGNGLGASGAANRIGIKALAAVAPLHVAGNAHMKGYLQGNPLDNWFVFELLGVLLGGAVAAYTAGRLKRQVIRGAGVRVVTRLSFAVGGGVVMGMAARMARGCTSGQALTGGAMLSVGSWVFMLAVFAGGYGLAYFVRRQWS
ncbi:MAG: YeeE/YedE family protein [Deltaproteobacteria bacterium]|nr:YeeE/YedE family protein [Deltaproteobacteria bacterium]